MNDQEFTIRGDEVAPFMAFHDNSEEVGRLVNTDGMMEFEGDVSASVQVLFDQLVSVNNDQMIELKTKLEAAEQVGDDAVTMWRAAEATIERMKLYCGHKRMCDNGSPVNMRGRKCDCGYDELQKELK
jgi:hypothetical protein